MAELAKPTLICPEAGLEVTGRQFVPEGDGGHALFWARLKPGGTPARGR